jgi:hypothetical protein
MAGGVCIDLKRVRRVSLLRLLQHRRSEGHDELMRRGRVIDPEVEVDLLRRTVRPVGRHMVRRQLHADSWSTVDLDHVPVVFGVDRSAEHARPEAALRGEIGSVEHDYLVIDLHSIIITATAGTRTRAL